MTSPLTALALVCSLKPSPAASSSDKLAREVLAALADHDVTGSVVRVVDHDVKPGVTADEGTGDDWPALRAQLLAADILVLATPTWVGQMSSVGHRVLERLTAELSETDDEGRLSTYGKVACVAVVGNEDGAHKITADALQALNDVGFSVAAQSATYWNGEAMQGTDYNDLDETPGEVAATTRALAANTAHLARLLKGSAYPPKG